MKNLLLLLFVARVFIPMGPKLVYDNVVSIEHQDNYYALSFKNGKTIYVPQFWTIIEEK